MNSVAFTVKNLALSQGLRYVGACNPEMPIREREALDSWQKAGFAGELNYMLKPSTTLTDPTHLLESAQQLLMFSVYYDRKAVGLTPRGFGRVARYAWGKDYHKVLKKRLERLLVILQEQFGREVKGRVFTDAVPVMERPLAKAANLGFIGKNSLLILPGEGSFSLIGGIVLNQILFPIRSEPPSTGSCGTCQRCASHCPTGAIVQDYVVDARRCISYLTIEKRGSLSWDEREKLGEWVFGCDICQDVCPFNFTALKEERGAHLDEFCRESGVGPFLSLRNLIQMRRDEKFIKVFGGTPLVRPKRIGLIRNAICVSVSKNEVELLPEITKAFLDDESEVIRQHALWALWKLSEREGAPPLLGLLEKARRDPAESVQGEALRIFEHRKSNLL